MDVLLVDIAIAFILGEAVVLLVFHRRLGRGIAPRRLVAFLGAGLFLMLALRAALSGASWPWLALCLAAAGIAHGIDLAGRWSRVERRR